jgi:hypothetical protein
MAQPTKVGELLKPLVPEPTPPRTIHGRLAAAMRRVSYIQKTGENKFHKYTYATESQVAAEVRAALLEEGLLLIPSVRSWERSERPTRDGKASVAYVTVAYRLVTTDTEEMVGFDMVGEGQDNGDKATAKAPTSCHKYAMLKLFSLATGDDPEADETTDHAMAPEASTQEVMTTAALLRPLAQKAGIHRPAILERYKVAALDELTTDDVRDCVAWLTDLAASA